MALFTALVPSWEHLGAILGRLGAILGRLAAILGQLGAILASKKPPEIAPRCLQDASQNEVQHRPQLETPKGLKKYGFPEEKQIIP